ncbi:MAG: hypothetical protein WCS15_02370 [Prevotella sp.]
MADENDISGKVGLDYADFQRGVTALNQQIKNIEVSFRGSASTMDDWSSTSEGLNLRIGSLNEKLTLQKTKLKALTDEFNLLNNSEGDHTKEQQRLAGQMASLEKQIGSTQSEVKKYSTSLDELDKDADETGASVDKAGKQAKQSGDDAKSGESGWSKFGDGLKTVGRVAGVAAVAASAAVGVMVKSSLDGYAEYEQLTGGVETLFKDSGDTVLNYANNAYKTAGLSANEYMSTATSFSASLISSLDGDTEKAAAAADVAITDMADNANKMGTSTQDVQNAYQSFARQNYGLLDNLKLGYGGTKTEMERLLSDAEKLSGQEYDITNLNDVYSAIHVVQTEMGITGTTAEEASTTIEGSTAAMGSAWGNLVSGIADDNADIDGLISNFIDSVIIAGENILPRVEQILYGVGEMISRLAPILSEKIPEILANMLPAILTAAGGIVTALLNGIIASIPAIIPAAVQLVGELGNSIIENLPLLVQAALEIILQLATSIADSLPELIPTIVDVVIQIVDTLIDNIDLLVDAAIAIMVALAEGLIDATPRLIEKAPEIIAKLVLALIENGPKLAGAAIELIVILANGMISSLGAVVDAAGEIAGAIKEKITGLATDALQWGKDIIYGIVNGIKSAADAVEDAVSNVAKTIWSYLHFSVPDKGPLSDADTYMPDMMKLLALGIAKNIGIVSNAASNAGGAISKGLANGIDDSASVVLKSATKMSNTLLTEETRLQNEIAKIQAKTQADVKKSDDEIQREALESQLAIVRDFKKQYDDAISAVQDSQDTMSEKLVSFGDLFTRTQTKFGETLDLGDLQSQIDSINEYGDSLESLKDRGVSDGLLEEIKGMSVDDATAYTQKLLGMTDEDYAKYMALWDEKQKAASDVAANFYKSELSTLKEEYVDKIPDELSGLKDEMSGLGENAAKGLASGFTLQEGFITAAFTNVLSSAMASAKDFLGIASPSKLFRDEIGVYLARGIGVGFSDEMAAVSQQMNKAIPTSFNTPEAPAQSSAQMSEGIVNGLAALLGSQNSSISIAPSAIYLDGKQVGQVMWPSFTDLARQKGVSFG